MATSPFRHFLATIWTTFFREDGPPTTPKERKSDDFYCCAIGPLLLDPFGIVVLFLGSPRAEWLGIVGWTGSSFMAITTGTAIFALCLHRQLRYGAHRPWVIACAVSFAGLVLLVGDYIIN